MTPAITPVPSRAVDADAEQGVPEASTPVRVPRQPAPAVRIEKRMLVVKDVPTLVTLDAVVAVDATAGVIFDLTAMLRQGHSQESVVGGVIATAERVCSHAEGIGRPHACAMYVGGQTDVIGDADRSSLQRAGVSFITGEVTDDLVENYTWKFNRGRQLANPDGMAVTGRGARRRT